MTSHILTMAHDAPSTRGTDGTDGTDQTKSAPRPDRDRPGAGRRDSAPERLVERPDASGAEHPDPRRIQEALMRHEAGEPLSALAEELGVSPILLERWRERSRDVPTEQIDRLIALERENARLRRLVETLRLDRYMLQQLLESQSRDGKPRP